MKMTNEEYMIDFKNGAPKLREVLVDFILSNPQSIRQVSDKIGISSVTLKTFLENKPVKRSDIVVYTKIKKFVESIES